MRIVNNYPMPFERVYLINLKERTDRLSNFRFLQQERGWDFSEPIILSAIKGDKVGVPSFFQQGGGAFGCRQSHIRALEDCLMDDVSSVLMLEDDVTWMKDCWEKLAAFMNNVPDDWDQLMLGGQHIKTATPVNDYVVRCTNAQRTHAYAIRGKAMKSLLAQWYKTNVHIDWTMGGWQKDWKVYAPTNFLFGQSGGKSDISGRNDNPKFWIQPQEEMVAHLDCPKEVVQKLRGHGVHTGYDRNAEDVDKGLVHLASHGKSGLRRWLDTVLWEAVSVPDTIVGVWHPAITPEDIEKVYKEGKVIRVKADTLEDAADQLRHQGFNLRPNPSATHLLVLRASRDVAEGLGGFHRGYWVDQISGYDNGLRQIACYCGEVRKKKLREWVDCVTEEAVKANTVPCVWHPEVSLEEVKEATSTRKVVEIDASSTEDALRLWQSQMFDDLLKLL